MLIIVNCKSRYVYASIFYRVGNAILHSIRVNDRQHLKLQNITHNCCICAKLLGSFCPRVGRRIKPTYQLQVA